MAYNPVFQLHTIVFFVCFLLLQWSHGLVEIADKFFAPPSAYYYLISLARGECCVCTDMLYRRWSLSSDTVPLVPAREGSPAAPTQLVLMHFGTIFWIHCPVGPQMDPWALPPPPYMTECIASKELGLHMS